VALGVMVAEGPPLEDVPAWLAGLGAAGGAGDGPDPGALTRDVGLHQAPARAGVAATPATGVRVIITGVLRRRSTRLDRLRPRFTNT
jgi:hypothetical protein